jgi:hypothetical protein
MVFQSWTLQESGVVEEERSKRNTTGTRFRGFIVGALIYASVTHFLGFHFIHDFLISFIMIPPVFLRIFILRANSVLFHRASCEDSSKGMDWESNKGMSLTTFFYFFLFLLLLALSFQQWLQYCTRSGFLCTDCNLTSGVARSAS